MDYLSAEEKLAIGAELPEELYIRDIVALWIENPSKRENTEIMLINDYGKGILKGTQFSCFSFEVKIKRNDFLTYLEYKGIPEPTECKLVKWLKRSEAKTSEAESAENRRGTIDSLKTTDERDLTRWFREMWKKEGRPEGSDFFNGLKSYVNKPGSPIIEHYTHGKGGPGIRLITGTGKIPRTKKAIQNMVSKFKKE